jgi:hypothetical protein
MLRDVSSNKIRIFQKFFANEWILNEGVTGTRKLIVSRFAVDSVMIDSLNLPGSWPRL